MPELRVLHLSTADNLGGSARSAYKIHCGLRRLGVSSRMLVGTRVTADPDVALVAPGMWAVLDGWVGRLTYARGWQYLYLPSSRRLLRHPWVREANIVQVYNTHGGYLSHTILPAICRRKRVVWRLSDMWPMTGHCSYPGDCPKWENGCGRCPDLATYPPLARDRTAFLWRRKNAIYQACGSDGIHVVATCAWMLDRVKRSPLLSRFASSVIPNGVETDIFRPLPKEWARGILGIPQDKAVLLVVAHSIGDNLRKGIEYVIPVVEHLANRNIMLMVVGAGAEAWTPTLPCPVWRRDYVREPELLALVYNAADVNLHLATVENLPNTVIEAMACGVPSVAFDTGGVRDVVRHGETGCLARPGNVADVVRGVLSILDSDNVRRAMTARGTELVTTRMTTAVQATAFRDLYSGLLDGRAANAC